MTLPLHLPIADPRTRLSAISATPRPMVPNQHRELQRRSETRCWLPLLLAMLVFALLWLGIIGVGVTIHGLPTRPAVDAGSDAGDGG